LNAALVRAPPVASAIDASTVELVVGETVRRLLECRLDERRRSPGSGGEPLLPPNVLQAMNRIGVEVASTCRRASTLCATVKLQAAAPDDAPDRHLDKAGAVYGKLLLHAIDKERLGATPWARVPLAEVAPALAAHFNGSTAMAALVKELVAVNGRNAFHAALDGPGVTANALLRSAVGPHDEPTPFATAASQPAPPSDICPPASAVAGVESADDLLARIRQRLSMATAAPKTAPLGEATNRTNVQDRLAQLRAKASGETAKAFTSTTTAEPPHPPRVEVVQAPEPRPAAETSAVLSVADRLKALRARIPSSSA
jgi:hypothetical protein